MQEDKIFKVCKTQPLTNNGYQNIYSGIQQKNFVNGLRNARYLLNGLEKSFKKTTKYEKKLLKCRASHPHLHDLNEWWGSDDVSEEKSKCSKTGTSKSTKIQDARTDFAESWTTMSIVCLQYQYEELSKRYSSLLQAYNERCTTLNDRDVALARLRQRVRSTHSRLAHAHRTLIMIGEKYLALREKRLAQKSEYEEKIFRLRRAMRHVVEEAERARNELDAQLGNSMCAEKDAATALLLDEIRKCNHLFLENLKLKAQLENISPLTTETLSSHMKS